MGVLLVSNTTAHQHNQLDVKETLYSLTPIFFFQATGASFATASDVSFSFEGTIAVTRRSLLVFCRAVDEKSRAVVDEKKSYVGAKSKIDCTPHTGFIGDGFQSGATLPQHSSFRARVGKT